VEHFGDLFHDITSLQQFVEKNQPKKPFLKFEMVLNII